MTFRYPTLYSHNGSHINVYTEYLSEYLGYVHDNNKGHIAVLNEWGPHDTWVTPGIDMCMTFVYAIITFLQKLDLNNNVD